MKRYKVTTEVYMYVRADTEEDAVQEARDIMYNYPEMIDDYSDYFEVEEVAD